MLKKVISIESGEEVIVDTDKAAVYSYSNRQRRIVKSAEIYEDGRPSGFFTTYIEVGTVGNIRDRLSTWDNALKLAYAHGADFDSTDDPDGSKYDAFIRSIEENQDKYFDEYGDFLPAYTVDVKGLVNAGFYSEEPLVPMGYLPLADYCKKHGLDMRNVRRKLAEGKMNGIKQANSWFLPEDEPYHVRMLRTIDRKTERNREVTITQYAFEEYLREGRLQTEDSTAVFACYSRIIGRLSILDCWKKKKTDDDVRPFLEVLSNIEENGEPTAKAALNYIDHVGAYSRAKHKGMIFAEYDYFDSFVGKEEYNQLLSYVDKVDEAFVEEFNAKEMEFAKKYGSSERARKLVYGGNAEKASKIIIEMLERIFQVK